jgi:hypothetical protein
MIIAAQPLDATTFLNHLVTTTINVPKIIVIQAPANVSSNKSTVMTITNVLTMNVYLNMVVATVKSLVMITMHVPVILVILALVVYLKIFLTNVKLTTYVTKIIVALLSDVLMI